MSTRAWKLTRRAVGLILLAVFLQWAGMTNPASQPGTLYSEIANAVAPGSGGSVAKLPPQQ